MHIKVMSKMAAIPLDPIPADEIISLFWGTHPETHRLRDGATVSGLNKRPYFDYFQLQCSYFTEISGVVDQRLKVMKYLVNSIKSDKSKEKIISELKHSREFPMFDDEESCELVLNLTARLLAMCNFGRINSQANPRQYLNWKRTWTLRDFLHSYFVAPPPKLQERPRFPKTFSAWAVEKIGGITIQFTDNLADHLLLINDDRTLLVFHQVSFLEYQTAESLLQRDLIEETLRSIALLFPQFDFSPRRPAAKEHRRWFKNLCQRHLDGSDCEADDRLIRCGALQANARQIENFYHWRDRLVVLKQIYDESTPATLSQWWFDRRNGPQWYTFWVAALVLLITTLLGLVQCVESALQVYKAYHPSRH